MKITKICIILIFILASLLRFWFLGDHFSISSDSSREVIIAHEAVRQMKIPVVGPFSSAGPFIFSPNWYYLLMIPTILAPSSILAPWIFAVMLTIAFVGVMILIGNAVAGKKFGLFLGLMSAVAPLPVQLSSLLMLHVPVSLFSAVCLLFFIKFIKRSRILDVFYASLGIGLALSMHYQALNLLIYIPFFVLLQKPRKLSRYILLALAVAGGIIIPLLPLLIWDSGWSFHNTREIIYFFRVGQKSLWVPNRWLTYVFIFWPKQIANMFGGYAIVGGIVAIVAGLSFAAKLLFSKIPTPIWFCGIVFLIQFVMLRYYPGEKYDVYLIYQFPLIILLFSWALYQICKPGKSIFFIVSFGIIVLGLTSLAPWIEWKNEATNLYKLRDQLMSRYPNEKFKLYGKTLSSSTCAYSFSMILSKADLAASSGRPIGLCLSHIDNCMIGKKRFIASAKFQTYSCVLSDLKGVPQKGLTKQLEWYPYYPEAVYNEIQYWWIKEKYESEKK